MEETKDKKSFFANKVNVVVAAILLFLIIISIVFAVLVFKDKNTTKIKFTGESNGIKYSANMKSYNSDIIVVMKNETGRTISELETAVTYFDKDGNEIKQKESSIAVYLKNGETSLNSIKSEIGDKSQIADYKVEVRPVFYEGEDRPSNYEKIDISNPYDKDNKIAAKVNNKTDGTIDHVCFYVVYFKDNVPVDLKANDVYSMKKGEKEVVFDKPTDKEGKSIEYDFCKVLIKY